MLEELRKFWFVKQMCSRYEGTMELKFNIRREPRFALQYMLLSFLFVFVDIGGFFLSLEGAGSVRVPAKSTCWKSLKLLPIRGTIAMVLVS